MREDLDWKQRQWELLEGVGASGQQQWRRRGFQQEISLDGFHPRSLEESRRSSDSLEGGDLEAASVSPGSPVSC